MLASSWQSCIETEFSEQLSIQINSHNRKYFYHVIFILNSHDDYCTAHYYSHYKAVNLIVGTSETPGKSYCGGGVSRAYKCVQAGGGLIAVINCDPITQFLSDIIK